MNNLSICFIDTLGLLYTGDTVYKRGLGGSESAIVYMGEELSDLGIHVTVYNKCEVEGIYHGVEYLHLNTIREEKRAFDILISSRSILPLAPQRLGPSIWEKFHKDIGPFDDIVANAKKKIVWMHDTFLEGEEYLEPFILDGFVDEVFLLSDWHSHYVAQANHWNTPKRDYAVLKQHIYQTRNGMRPYLGYVDISQKDPNLFVYNSSITKGMIPLVTEIWPRVIQEIPQAKLIVIGGYYRNAGKNDGADESEIKFFQMKEEHDGKNNVHFTGVIPQSEIATILARATYLIYPPDFPETFGISTLEALNYCVVPITAKFGALEQTAVDDMSFLMNYNIKHDGEQQNRFIQLVKRAYNDKYLLEQKQNKCREVKPWIGWDTVALQWKAHFYRLFDMMMDRQEIERVRLISSNINRIFKVRHLNNEEQFEFFPHHDELPIVIVSPVYNAAAYIENCIRSVAMQIYDNYQHYIIDDMSTDDTAAIAEKCIAELPENIRGNFYVIRNTTKSNAVGNQIKILQDNFSADTIFALLDGDDWLYNDPDVFNFLNELYHNDTDISYGSCFSIADKIPLIAQEYPAEIRRANKYREHKFRWGIPYTHLRTFTKELFDKIDVKQLRDANGNFFGPGGDGALLYTLLEAANWEKVKCVQRLLVNYNDLNPLNDYKINGKEQNMNRDVIANNKVSTEELTYLYQGVRDKNPEALRRYKQVITERDDAHWIDPIDATCIKPRVQWLDGKLAELQLSKDSNILDIGSWTGTIANHIYELGYHNIDCLDISQEVVKIGKETFPHLNWHQGDIEQISSFEKQYDVILIFEVLEHLANPLAVLEKLNTFLAPNGKIIFTVPREDWVFRGHSREHISMITKENLAAFNAVFTELEIPEHAWYIGYIPKKDSNKITNILIGIPTAKYIECDTFKSIFNLVVPPQVKLHFQNFYGYNIAQIRNLMADYTIRNNFDYMLWVDSDIVLPSDTLLKLLSPQKDIVSGVYIQRKPEKKIPEIYLWNSTGGMSNATVEDMQAPRLLEVAGCGFGCVLTSRKVLQDIGYPQFHYHDALDHKDTVSEDVDFCIKAKNKGYKIYVDTSIKCNHIGSTVFVV